ncbi:MAG: hypothetical protein ABEJ03_00995 [Candidatus Nanohaloarchaea archaeon]
MAIVVSLMLGIVGFMGAFPILQDSTNILTGGNSENPELVDAKRIVSGVCESGGEDTLYDPPSGATLDFDKNKISLEGVPERRGDTTISLDDVECEVQDKDIKEGGWEVYRDGEGESAKVKFR